MGGGQGHDHVDSEWAGVGCRGARRGARDQGRKADSQLAWAADKTHTRSQAGLHCVWPDFSIGDVGCGRLRQLQDAFAFTCSQLAGMLACLAGQGRADDTALSGVVWSRGQPTGDGATAIDV